MSMRRAILVLLLLAAAPVAFANPFYLDRSGVLWTAGSDANGMVITGEQDGKIVQSTLIPFPFGGGTIEDRDVSVVADELTGKLVVVWQRVYGDGVSEVMLAVHDGRTSETFSLTDDFSANPRFPSLEVNQASSWVDDPEFPEDPAKRVEIVDSFVQIAWTEGVYAQGTRLAVLRLSTDEGEVVSPLVVGPDDLLEVGECAEPITPATTERSLFVANSTHDRATLFFGSERDCSFHLLDVRFELEPLPEGEPSEGFEVTAQRRRHRPVFGVRGSFPAPEFTLEASRMLLGPSSQPVVYRIGDGAIEYVVGSEKGWSDMRRLPARAGLTLEQAIPLVENLAR